MPTFKATIRKGQLRKDGKYPVSIRVTHNRISAYVPTGVYVSKKQVNKHYEIKDQFVIGRTNQTIQQYERKILEIDTEDLREMSVQAIVAILTRSNKKVDYLAYCENLIAQDAKKWCGLKHALLIAKRIGYEQIMLRDVDRIFVDKFRAYIETIEIPASRKKNETKKKKLSSRIKNEYMMRLHQVYKMIVLELGKEAGDYTKFDPFVGVKLFKKDAPKKGAIPIDDLRAFFAYKTTLPKEQLAQDMIKMSFCLGGMNFGDLILVTKDCLDGEYLKYQRHKTKDNRADGAWTAIKIQPEIQDLVEKYKAKKGERLFDFGLEFNSQTSRNFGMSVDRICKHAGLPHYNPYLFRHTVASIARNKFRYSRDDVGMLLNHMGAMTVDDVYIDNDWSINDEINRKILDYVFNGGEPA
jgi:integrase